MRSGLAPGNLDPDSKFLPLHLAFQGLFTSDSPSHVFYVEKSDMDHVSSLIDVKRGVRPHIYDDIFTGLDIDSNERANKVAFFMMSMAQPFLPFIMLTSTRSEAALMYFRKYGCTIFSWKTNLAFVDYVLNEEWQITEMVTRSIYVQDPSDFNSDMWIGPNHTHIERLVSKSAEKLALTGVISKPYLFKSTFETNIQLPYPNYVYNENEYILTLADVAVRTDFDWTTRIVTTNNFIRKRKFIVAPSGSGKTTWINGHIWGSEPLAIDADTLLIWPKKDKWWEDEALAFETNNVNVKIILEWLSGENDGKVLLYADTFGGRVAADAVVLIPDEVHQQNLKNRLNKNQPGIDQWERILDTKNKIREFAILENVQIFDNFSSAFGFALANGRIQLANKNRFMWKIVFPVKKSVLPDFPVQTVYSGQTSWVKSITYFASRVLNLGNSDMEVARRLAMAEFGIRTIGHNRISGFYKYKGNLIPVAVSGHMVNYVILSTLIPLDWNRLFDQIFWNFDLYLTKRKLTTYEKKVADAGLYSEILKSKDVYSLWHNIPEWIVAIRAGIIFSEYLGLTFKDYDIMNSFIERAEEYGKSSPRLYGVSVSVHFVLLEGFKVEDFLSKSDIRGIRDWSTVEIGASC